LTLRYARGGSYSIGKNFEAAVICTDKWCSVKITQKFSGDVACCVRSWGGSVYFGRNQWQHHASTKAADTIKAIYPNFGKQPYYEK